MWTRETMKPTVVCVLYVATIFPALCGGMPQVQHFTRYLQGAGWRLARHVCRQDGAHLAQLDRYNGLYLYQALAADSSANSNNIWIGLHDVALRNGALGGLGYRWSTCQVLADTDWSDWQNGTPAANWNNFCFGLGYQNNFQWFGEYCGSSFHFLCQASDGMPCTEFVPFTDSCVIDKTTQFPTGLSATSTFEVKTESDCQTACIDYVVDRGNGFPSYCWMYDFKSSTCTLYEGLQQVFCVTSLLASVSNVAHAGWRVRKCYTLSHNKTQLTNLPTFIAKEPAVNCTGLTSETKIITTQDAATIVATTTSATSKSSPTETTQDTSAAPKPLLTTATTTTTMRTTTTATSSAVETSEVTLSEVSAIIGSVVVQSTIGETVNAKMVTQTSTSPQEETLSEVSTTIGSVVESTINGETVNTEIVTKTSTNPHENTMSPISGELDVMTSRRYQCMCTCYQGPTVPLNYSVALKLAHNLRSTLTLNKSDLSATRRRKESAPDHRPSAQAAGGLGIAIMVLVFGTLVTYDIISVFRAMWAFLRQG